MRSFRTFGYRDASYRISPEIPDVLYSRITNAIIELREELETYIKRQPDFLKSLVPVELLSDAPEIAIRMTAAAELTGIGPMASVAGIMAELAAKRSAAKRSAAKRSAAKRSAAEDDVRPEIIIENGGDIFILPSENPAPVTAGIFSGLGSKFSGLALKIEPEPSGTAVCSSSGRMGHSLSLGDCDLCTVISSDAALADSAATLGGNLVKTIDDLKPAAEKIAAIKGVTGVLLIKNDQLAMAGKLPQIIRHDDPAGLDKITGKFLQ